ncbi:MULTISPECIES: hypothetical protein [Geobacillus]|uniref:TubC N-terminal docking domain-containing protein n=1 Tax=Bacillus caldolyticus TaxID=1394 RepID=A0ABN5FVS3_BACCL|nr:MULTISPECIES: hypothetical protein [Geobacillus]AMV11721.1 hypothetical protein GT3570_12385 [Geobacillus thermoleovorans]AUI37758.1 hypothetical protein CWI35_15630 [[Bacillus] caldolyticus]KLR73831.1 hypothetical protein ABH20_08965 [Geobacillus sp. T6]
MLYNIFYRLENLNIQIKVKNNKISLLYKDGSLPMDLKKQIQQHKEEIKRRLEENEQARRYGFLIYAYGELYEFRYGKGSYLFIEREGNKAIVWRGSYIHGDPRPYRIKVLANRVPFHHALAEAVGFIEWLKRQEGRANIYSL